MTGIDWEQVVPSQRAYAYVTVSSRFVQSDNGLRLQFGIAKELLQQLKWIDGADTTKLRLNCFVGYNVDKKRQVVRFIPAAAQDDPKGFTLQIVKGGGTVRMPHMKYPWIPMEALGKTPCFHEITNETDGKAGIVVELPNTYGPHVAQKRAAEPSETEQRLPVQPQPRANPVPAVEKPIAKSLTPLDSKTVKVVNGTGGTGSAMKVVLSEARFLSLGLDVDVGNMELTLADNKKRVKVNPLFTEVFLKLIEAQNKGQLYSENAFISLLEKSGARDAAGHSVDIWMSQINNNWLGKLGAKLASKHSFVYLTAA